MSWKYIMVQVEDQAIPIIFPGILVHADIWKFLRRPFFDMSKTKDPVVVSAGFIPGFAIPAAVGESETLNRSAREEDTRIINNHPYEYGREGLAHNLTEKLLINASIDMLTVRLQELE